MTCDVIGQLNVCVKGYQADWGTCDAYCTVQRKQRNIKFGRLSSDEMQGIEEGSISSSFTGEQWEEWLQKNVT